MKESDNEREYRVINQLMTAHSILRDRCNRRGLALSTGILAISVALNAFVFTSDEILRLVFRGNAEVGKLGLQITSVILLVFSIIELKVNWEADGRSHEEALKRLGRLKAKYRRAHTEQQDNTRQNELAREFAATMDEIPPIPEGLFAKLKAAHEFKHLLSRKISAHPGVPHWILAILLRCSATFKVFKE